MRFTGLIEVLHGEKISINDELVIKATDILMSKTMPGVIWYRAELIVLGLIGKIKLVPQWLQGQSVSARESGLLPFLLTSR